ncbi:hypothetical protein [Conexibacter arvalis]|uniref:Uncharacterized protein n=1 Tax=Conexibacter arvalis TaxID=912552 RepID=A0A840IDF1_9ACTN|nr:hypothetical protein [Conexibacter arvalis]MBB4662977.1 hypothetical protein [Conexibacter arvalis]
MTEILDTIELELIGAVRRHNARARRRRLKGAIAAAAATVALAGTAVTATVVDTPLDTLFPGGAETAQPADEGRSTVVAGGAGAAWSVTAYRSRGDWLSTVIVRRPRQAGSPPVQGRSGLVVALQARGGVVAGPATDAVARGGRIHAVVGGAVDASVRAVAVSVGGRRYEATVADAVVRVPVALRPGDIPTPELRRRLDALPDEIVARSFAVALAPAAPGGPLRAQATIEATFADGRVVSERHSICVSPRCAGT